MSDKIKIISEGVFEKDGITSTSNILCPICKEIIFINLKIMKCLYCGYQDNIITKYGK